MTERWRKKLEGIDRVGPSDDVYERAKAGPSMSEPQSPMQRTSTRVVTATAAFVVFALAISVFAIPALRLGGKPSFVSAGGDLQPLWPWNSIDAVQAWRDDPQPIGTTSVDHFSSPAEVAAGFGRDVLGWTEVWPVEDVAAPAGGCGANQLPPGITPSPTTGLCSVIGVDRSSPPGLLPVGPTTAPAEPFPTFELLRCPPGARCPAEVPAKSARVVMFQPLGTGGPWSVLEATNEYMGMSLDPGAPLHDGSTVYASGLIPSGAHAVLGFSTSLTGCEGTGAETGFEQVGDATDTNLAGSVAKGTYARGNIQIGLHPMTVACREQPGYVYIGLTQGDLGTGDPLAGMPAGANVIAFAAVPASFVFPSPQDSGAPPISPTEAAADWTSHTDPLGWTIDVPANWSTMEETNHRVRFQGDGLAVEISPLGVSDTDDSSVPLGPGHFLTQGEGGLIGDVRGDGSSYAFIVFKDDGGFMSLDQLSDAQTAILNQMIASITFPPSKLGEGRNGWTAIAPVLESASAEWIIDKLTGDHYLASLTDKGARVLFGPAPACPVGVASYEVRETGVAAVVCPDGTEGDWDLSTGKQKPGNPTGFDGALIAHDAVRSWDGWLLAHLGPTPSPTSTPTP